MVCLQHIHTDKSPRVSQVDVFVFTCSAPLLHPEMFVFLQVSRPSRVRNLVHTSTRSLGSFHTSSCWFLTWTHSDMLQMIYQEAAGEDPDTDTDICVPIDSSTGVCLRSSSLLRRVLQKHRVSVLREPDVMNTLLTYESQAGTYANGSLSCLFSEELRPPSFLCNGPGYDKAVFTPLRGDGCQSRAEDSKNHSLKIRCRRRRGNGFYETLMKLTRPEPHTQKALQSLI
ncbi:unnamed protein product [Pleuronectes platessa]|uniref:Uncharacterized protein n=1 Tax=Pleuronectes platessa TaxID=8262 RepID=A0A9N7U5L5_PLEPL|nr:unnamed protein product [Pleuronectes platessa]